MNPSNPAKVGIAFAAGIIVALASAVVYVRTSGMHLHEPTQAETVQYSTQPQNLNTSRVDERGLTQRAKPAAPVVQVTAQSVSVPEPVKVRPAAPPAVVAKPQRTHYPHRSSLPESQSSIRVEVSQMSPSSVPAAAVPEPTPQPAPAPASVPVRAVNEDQAARYNPPPPPPPAQPHTVTLPQGTNLFVRLGETVSTDHNFKGDTFRATLDRSIILDGFVIAEKGSKVLGKIVDADKSGKFEGTANLQLTLTEINTTDGQRVRIETGAFVKKGPSNTGQDVAKIAGGAALGAIIGVIAGGGKGAAIGAGAGGAAGTGAVLLGKGRPATIPNETQLTFQLSNPTTITERLN